MWAEGILMVGSYGSRTPGTESTGALKGNDLSKQTKEECGDWAVEGLNLCARVAGNRRDRLDSWNWLHRWDENLPENDTRALFRKNSGLRGPPCMVAPRHPP
jgi:hypothetical protein